MAVTLLQKEIRRHLGILQKSSGICDFSEILKIKTYFTNPFFADIQRTLPNLTSLTSNKLNEVHALNFKSCGEFCCS